MWFIILGPESDQLLNDNNLIKLLDYVFDFESMNQYDKKVIHIKKKLEKFKQVCREWVNLNKVLEMIVTSRHSY